MTATLNIALIGHGYAGRVFHVPLIAATPGLALHTIVSGNPETARTRPHVRVLDQPSRAFDDPAIDAVVIATPNDTHAPLAIAALTAGKHVLVDKPFALTSIQAHAIAACAQDNGRVVSVFQNRRWDGDFLTVKHLVEQGELGRIAEFHSHFDRFRPQVRDRWRENDVAGAGLWFDLGPHLLDQALLLFGWPQALQADITRQRDGARSDDYFHVTLHYPRLRVMLHAGTLVADARLRFAVHGDNGSYLKEGLDTQEDMLRDGRLPGCAGWGTDPEQGRMLRMLPDGSAIRSQRETVTGDYRICYARWRDAIVHGGAPPVTMVEAIDVMALLETAALSADTGQRIVLAQR